MITLLVALQPSLAAPAPRYEATQAPPEVQSILDAAVERSVQGVPWAFRGMARPRLKPLATACEAYLFQSGADWLSVQCVGKSVVRRTVGRSEPWVDAKGKELQSTLTRSGEKYTLDFRGDDGGKRFTYDFSEAGRLSVTQEVYSPNLAVPMVWTLEYAAK